MAGVVLDSGAVTFLATPSRLAQALILELRDRGTWPPSVPSIVLVECLQGHAGRDANTNRFLRTCDIEEDLPDAVVRRAAFLRARARRGSAVDAVVVALAEPVGMVITSDPGDLGSLAARSTGVQVRAI